MDASLVEAAITEKTRAILPIHMFGLPADMPAIMEIAKRHDLKVVEDCAQSFGASVGGDKVGAIVMDTLARIDTVAYVRFASVYKNFQEADDFEEFVAELRPPEPSEAE